MPTYKESYIDVKGSDGNRYIVDMEHVNRNTVEFSLVINKTWADIDYLKSTTNNDIPNRLVEEYIQKAKKTFGVQKGEVYSILDALTSATISNHFDYLKLLREIAPKIEKLLQ